MSSIFAVELRWRDRAPASLILASHPGATLLFWFVSKNLLANPHSLRIICGDYSKFECVFLHMNIATAKVDLVKKILNTESKAVISYLQAIFESQPENWLEELPVEIKASLERGLKESQQGQGRPHGEVMKKFRSWKGR
jgi:hypothetical protein